MNPAMNSGEDSQVSSRSLAPEPRQSGSAAKSGSPSAKVHTSFSRRPGSPVGGRFNSIRGESLLEFALVFPMFMLLVCGIIDFSRVYYSEAIVQNALVEAGRYAITGQCCLNDSNGNPLTSREASIQQYASQMAPGFNWSAMTITSGGATGSAGGPGQLVTLSISQSVPLITAPIASYFFNGSGVYTFTASVTYKNEPF